MTLRTSDQDVFVTELNRAFRRNLKFWAIRWTVGLIAMAWFAFHFPQHWWIVLIGFGMALISVIVLVAGRLIVLRRHFNRIQTGQFPGNR